MKSIVSYPFEFNNLLFPPKTPAKSCGKLVAHFELFKKVKHLEGAIIKCGVSVEEGFSRFELFRDLIGTSAKQKMIAFQRFEPFFEQEVDKNGEVILRVSKKNKERSSNHSFRRQANLKEDQSIELVPGQVCESIPAYLIDNPELKIAMLNIDLDHYEGTLTAMEFFYPRLVSGGILIIDNYHKNIEERKAIERYFYIDAPRLRTFSVSKGPHYIIKP